MFGAPAMPLGSEPLLARFAASLRTCGVGPRDPLAVALSGGPDSLALAAMARWWQQHVRSDEPPLALIVDHKLRPESTDEALAVAARAEAVGLAAHVLTVHWPGGALPQRGEKMAAARDARYELLLSAAAAARRRHLLLAHHADDQAETFLLRLLHGSGLAGLACMPAVANKQTEHGPIALLRPLLSFRKAELEGYCRHEGLHAVQDPTNADLSFLRNCMRHLLRTIPQPAAAAAGILPGCGWAAGDAASSSRDRSLSIVDDVLLLQRRCEQYARQQQAAEQVLLASAVLRTSCPGLPSARQQACQPEEEQQQQQLDGRQPDAWPHPSLVALALRSLRYALLDVGCLAAAPGAAALGSLARVLQAVAGLPYPPPLAQLQRLQSRLQGGRLRGVFTGGGCLVQPVPRSRGRLAVCVAQGDVALAQAALTAARQPRRRMVGGAGCAGGG